MRKPCGRLCLLTVSIFVLCLCASCAGAADWTSVKLAGDYAVMRSNTETIQLCLMETDDMTVGTPTGGKMVTEVAYNEDYILEKCKEPADSISEWRNLFKRYYYIVDVKEGKTTGPYEKSDFETACEEMGIPSLDWKNVDGLERAE